MALVLKRLRRWCHVLKSHPTDWDKPGIEPVKILLALEPYGLFGSNLAHLFFFNIKTVKRVCRASFWPVEIF